MPTTLLRNLLIVSSIGLFLCGLIPDFFLHALSPLGWIPVFVLYFQTPSWIKRLKYIGLIYLVLATYGLSWLLFINEGFFVVALVQTVWILPIYFVVLSFVDNYLKFKGWAKPLFIGGIWVAYEALAALTPGGATIRIGLFAFPLPLLQITHYASYLVLSFLWVGFSSSMALLFLKSTDSKIKLTALALGLLLISAYIFGNFVLLSHTKQQHTIRTALIQHNFSYFRRESDPLGKMVALAKQAQQQNHPELIIFPLYSLPQKTEDQLDLPNGFFVQLARTVQASILIGSGWHDPQLSQTQLRLAHTFWGATFLFSPNRSRPAIYRAVEKSFFHNKQQVLEKEFKLLDAGFAKLGILLCYESVQSKWSALAKKMGAQVLFGLSNTMDIPYSVLPYYTLRQDQMRAIETGLYFVRATPNGFSALIDPQGRILKRSKRSAAEILFFDLPLKK